MWWYSLSTLVLWVVNPGIRRLYDLYFGFSQIEILAVLPLLSLTPHAWSLTFGGGWRRLPPLLKYAAWIWLGAFLYGLITAFLSGNMLAGTYEFITFVYPIGLGLWIAADEADYQVAYKRVTRVLFALATFCSVYGIVQYIIAPPWDVNWLKEVIKAGTTSFGYPYPFQIRVFSTLNDPGSFSMFLAATLLFALPELSLRRPILLLQIPIWFIAFGLTLVRTGWIMFTLGAVAYILLSPRRVNLIPPFAIAIAFIMVLVAVIPSIAGNDNMLASLSLRFATLNNLDEDISRRERQELYNSAPKLILAVPFGTGLGMLGSSTRLGSAGVTTDFDSGYLGRSLEMGLPGFVLYIIPQGIFFFAATNLWTKGRRQRNDQMQSIAGVAVAVLVSFMFLQFAHDPNGFPELTFWLIECLAICALPGQKVLARPSAHA